MKLRTYLLLLIFLFVGVSCFGQPIEVAKYSKEQVNNFIQEVFADQSEVLVFKSTSGREALIISFFERFHIINKPNNKGKQYPLLSSIPLLNKYNANLSRDAVVNPTTFNPLKYALPMASKKKEIFRVDGTDYLIIIEPVK